jgi:molybdate transport system ATP-binding protein
VDVLVAIGDATLRSLITRESCERLALAPGVRVFALIRTVALDRRSVAA